ncbi:DUF1254 domain-containing protein [Cyanobium sp. NIES-981]|uniref:DUF1254 domain-containing protein n=1 Tax=Cyanobium sp. NIES-981 TaxID=1851505 RepID=UPI0007DD04A0|nr:DUF1254 domain-containing protein [Cyanobium sp. NIES-981]SBO43679.1 conserved exported protein of unknown function [Cyanobium sp. NIES-981]
MIRLALCCRALAAALALAPLAPVASLAQVLKGPPADPSFRYSTPIPPGVAIPDTLETRLGTLRFQGGVPDASTTDRLLDNLDFQRAVQAYLLGLPPVNQLANRSAILTMGPANRTVPIWEQLVDSRTVELTANDNTPYTWFWLDLRQGPLVLEVPPKVLGLINDMWYRWSGDLGITGADKGRGGKYLLLPPGYKGATPSGYYVIRPSTFSIWAGWRSFLVDGDPKPGVDAVRARTKIYPLAQAANPVKPTFVNMSGKPFNMVGPSGFRFWEMLNQVVQDEPTTEVDPTTLGLWASIGIQKGKPFAPDARMKAILTEAAAVGDATARALAYRMRDRQGYIYDNANWRYAFFGGYTFEWQPGVANLDAAAFFFFLATGVTPAMDTKIVGEGSTYPWTALDANDQPLDGGRTYRLRLPPNVPAKNFWSVIVYNAQTRSMQQTNQQFPSVSSQNTDLQTNADGSVDVYFGPKPPAGKESNWIQTVPGQSWFTILRLYGPLEPWFQRTWRPGEIEPLS